ncbi:FG-GAP repeat domain-containing protein [Zobellia uliginosa]|uniref:FG-GAP repeat domain-containing protein n=1 Tax=Zobellia uliginosa TaxID=143224 RepID=UPI003F53B94A
MAEIAKDSIKEDVTAIISDFNSDGKNDLIVGTGGGDFYNKMEPLLDSYYIQNNTTFETSSLPESFKNTSVIAPFDVDEDGDLDLFVGGQTISNDFGKVPESALLINENGTFLNKNEESLSNLGMVTDAIWTDFDADGTKDLIVIGEWMSPVFFKNVKGKLSKVDVIQKNLNGLWQTIVPFDIDHDGDTDYLLGNWGSNTKFKASAEHPMKMFYGDFDNNRQTETITTIEKDGKYYPLEGLDGLSSQLVSLKKKFTTYTSFAGSSIEDILDKEMLNKAEVLEVNELRSGYLKNENGDFGFVAFRNELQVSPIMAMLSHDFDVDGKKEVLVAGNYFGVKPYQGRFDSFGGALIKDQNNVILAPQIGLDLSLKSVRHLNIIELKNEKYLLVTVNNKAAEVYRLKRKQNTNE